MELPTANTPALRQQLALFLMGLILAVGVVILGLHVLYKPDPYVLNVLALNGSEQRGHDIFQLNCATCHGLQAMGEVGPDLRGVSDRKSKSSLIHQVISGNTPPMPQFQPSPQDMADLLKFLETL